MKLLPRAAAVAAAAVLASGACYHAVVDTGAPAGATVVRRPWTATWVFGLVEAREVDVSEECPRGIARVETQQTVLNALASVVTFGIYTPRTVTVTCASASSSRLGRVLDVADARRHPEALDAALAAAAAESGRTGVPVFVRF